jgi:uncharacterized membrane protein
MGLEKFNVWKNPIIQKGVKLMRNLIIREGKSWVKEGIISEEQFDKIINRYQPDKRSNLLPILASILIGLGILTFVASNWNGIPHLARVLLILVVMIGFYVAGEKAQMRGKQQLGNGLIGIGVIAFGAGIILLGQMFHFQSYDAKPFVIWGIASLLVVQLWRSKFLLLLSILIITVGQAYSFMTFSSFSFILALLLLFGVGHFIFHRPDEATSVFFSISYLMNALFFIIDLDLNYQFLFVFYLALYLLSDLIKKEGIRHSIQLTMLIGAVVVTIFNVFWIDSFIYEDSSFTNGLIVNGVLITILLVLFVFRKRRTPDFVDGLLFLPVFYVGEMGAVLYLFLLFAYSIFLLIVGYQKHLPDKATLGTVLFLISAFVGYVQLAWDFMPKSLFFLIGGIILFMLSWFLEKNRRKLVKGAR